MYWFRRICFILPCFALLSLTACGDEDNNDDNDNDVDVNPCDNNSEFCVDYGSKELSGTAELIEITQTHYQLQFTSDENVMEQIYIDIYGTAVGTYVIDTTDNPASASLQYFDATGGTVYAVDGTLELTGFQPDDAGLSGTFTATMEDSTEVTNGNFQQVDKEDAP